MTPINESFYKLGLNVIANSILDAAEQLHPLQVTDLSSLTFKPCGKPDCNCHEISTDIRNLLLKAHAHITLYRPHHSPLASASEGFAAQAPPQNPKLN